MNRTIQPCGCVVVTDDTPVTINDVPMGHMIANVSAVEWCAVHQAEADASMQAFVDRMDKRIADHVYGDMKRRPALAFHPDAFKLVTKGLDTEQE